MFWNPSTNLTQPPNPSAYPLSALGPVIAPAVIQHQQQTSVAIEMIAVSALAAVQAAVQDLVDVQRPDCAPSPCGGLYVVVAGTAQGKDTAVSPFVEPFREVEKELDVSSADDRVKEQVNMSAWQIRKRILLGRLEEAIASEMDSSRKVDTAEDDELDEEDDRNEKQGTDENDRAEARIRSAKLSYEVHLANPPEQAPKVSIIHSDWTPSGLMRSAEEGSKSILLLNTEAADVLNNLLGRFNSFFNASFDSTPIPRARADGRTSFSDYRVSALFGIQPDPFFKRIDRWGAAAESSGTLGRLLFAAPHSTLGTRVLREQVQLDLQPKRNLQGRLRTLAQAGVLRRRNGQPRKVVGLSPTATRYFRDIYNEFQIHAAPGMILNGMVSQAGRGAEHTARTACALHELEGRTGDIEIDVLDRARLIIDWHISQYLRLLASDRPSAQLESDANSVAQALLQAAQYRLEHVSRKELKMWCAPDMTATRFQRAVQLLIERHLVVPKKDGRGIYLAAAPMLLWRPHQFIDATPTLMSR